jgi:hypothetical protein
MFIEDFPTNLIIRELNQACQESNQQLNQLETLQAQTHNPQLPEEAEIIKY